LVWNRLTRPPAVLMAFCVHGGIALFLGMPTFGVAMMIANLAFVPPEFVSRALSALRTRFERGRAGGEERGAKSAGRRPDT
jgi:hypothetical protein